MSVAAVAFVPSAPLLVPAVAGRSATRDAELRAACLDCLSRALDSEPDDVVVVASTPVSGTWTGDATWKLAGFGVDRTPEDSRDSLPWSLGIGAWLLDECGWSAARHYIGLGVDAGDEPAMPVSDRTVVLAIGDGSACRTERAPGHLDPRAEAFDDVIADCLSRGDRDGLAGIDALLARELVCGGPPVWRWVGATVGGSPIARSELMTHVAPYGVAYFVALWSF